MAATMMHDRRAARLVGKPFKVDKVTAAAQADVGVFTFGPKTTVTTKTVMMQQITYLTSKKTLIVPVAELYAPSEPNVENLRQMPIRLR